MSRLQNRGARAPSADVLRGELWWAAIPEVGEQPVVLISRDGSYDGRRRATVALVTSTIRGIPVEVPVGPANGLGHDSVINADELQTIRITWLVERIGDLSPEQRARLGTAMRFALGL
jgi:mRNA interferase MazF